MGIYDLPVVETTRRRCLWGRGYNQAIPGSPDPNTMADHRRLPATAGRLHHSLPSLWSRDRVTITDSAEKRGLQHAVRRDAGPHSKPPMNYRREDHLLQTCIENFGDFTGRWTGTIRFVKFHADPSSWPPLAHGARRLLARSRRCRAEAPGTGPL